MNYFRCLVKNGRAKRYEQTGIISFFIFLLTGCQNKPSLESQRNSAISPQNFQLEKSKYDNAEVTLHYIEEDDPAYLDKYLAIEPVVLNTELSDKVLEFESNVRNLGNLDYIGSTGAGWGVYKCYQLEIKKENNPTRQLTVFENWTYFLDRDEDRAKHPSADGEPLYLSYSLSDKDKLDTSFLNEIKSIVYSSEIRSRKLKDCY